MKPRHESVAIQFGPLVRRMNVRIWTPPGATRRLICTHGMGASGAEFAVLAERLGASGFEVICPDWLGHGDSQFLWQVAGYRWETYVSSLVAVCRKYATGDEHLLGVSWGGMMLLLFLMYSRRRPRSALFVDTPIASNDALIRHHRSLHEQAEARFDSIDEAETYLFKRRPVLGQVPEHLRDYFRDARFHRQDEKIALKYDAKVVAAMGSYLGKKFDNSSTFPRLKCEALFLYGETSPYRNPALFDAVRVQHPNIAYWDALPGGHPPSLLEEAQIAPIEAYLKTGALPAER
ncbi:MAG: alpha/beta hydrolase [Rhodospirillaceae bacterium]|mgnify:CR=1 FL=1|nr:alpha/beta hydrolase [Rhodospirillaceae bacterium]